MTQTANNNSLVLSGFLYESAAQSITAGTTRTQAGATALTKEVNKIDTSTAPSNGTTLGDGVLLPVSYPGLDVTIINNTANIIQVYGNGSDTINGVAGATGVPVPPYCVEQFECAAAGAWFYDAGVGFSGALNTVLSVDNISAAGSSQGTATALPADFNRIITVTAGQGVVLPAAKAGMDIFVLNHGANSVQVYANGSDTIDDIAGSTGVPQMVKSVVLYTCYATGSWYTNGLATGYASGGLQTLQFADALTAAGNSQATGLQLAGSINRITTVTAGQGVNLPASTAGLAITVINNGANAVQVYPVQGGSETINGIAAGTGVVQMVQSVVTYYCTVAGTWIGVGLGTGYSSSFTTTSFADGLSTTGTVQAGATLVTTSLARFTTVGSANGACVLPASTAGLNITIINAGANTMLIYPASGEYVNALAQNAAFALIPGGVCSFYSTLASKWHTLLAVQTVSSSTATSVYNTNSTNTTQLLTAANITGANDVTLNMTGALGGAANATLPVCTAAAAAFPNLVAGQTFTLRVINSSSGAFAWTLVTNTGWTLNGTMTVNQNTARDFIVTFNTTSTATIQSVGTVNWS